MASALVNLFLGFVHSFILFAILWGISGSFKSMGAAACVVGLSYMFAQWIGTPIPALVPVSTILTFICSWSFTYLVSKLPHAKYIIG